MDGAFGLVEEEDVVGVGEELEVSLQLGLVGECEYFSGAAL